MLFLTEDKEPGPDIETVRMTPIDVVTLTSIEVYAVLVHLTGNSNPEVTEALLEATRTVLRRTRSQ